MDGLHIRAVHLFKELAGVCGKGFDVTPLALGKEGVKGQGRFPGARHARDDRNLSPGDPAGNVLEIVRSCANDFDEFFHADIITWKNELLARLAASGFLSPAEKRPPDALLSSFVIAVL